MEIIGETAHRLLTYVEAVTRQGHVLTVEELSAYEDGWEPKVTFSPNGQFAGMIAALQQLSRAASASMGTSDAGTERESFIDFLGRVRWLRVSDGTVEITSLGKAVLREANAPLPPSDVGSTLEVVIDPNDPFAYAQLVSRISGFDECLIVDPYLDLDQLMMLSSVSSVNRILTSNKRSKTNVPVFAVALGVAPHLELRMAEEKLLHDRIVIPAEGSALMLGSSLASITRRFGVATPLEETSSRLIRDEYNKIWDSAKVIEAAGSGAKQGLAVESRVASGGASGESPEFAGDDLGDK